MNILLSLGCPYPLTLSTSYVDVHRRPCLGLLIIVCVYQGGNQFHVYLVLCELPSEPVKNMVVGNPFGQSQLSIVRKQLPTAPTYQQTFLVCTIGSVRAIFTGRIAVMVPRESTPSSHFVDSA